MDFDDEMSGLQIEDLGEYFLQTDIGDSWKGFSLGYVEEEKSPGQQFQQSQQQPNYNTNNNAVSSQAMHLNNSLMNTPVAASSAPIAIPNSRQNQQQQQQFTSPPMSSFSEMLKHGHGFSLNSPRQDFSFSPALFASAANLLKADVDGKMNNDPMDLSNFSLDALKKIPQMQQPLQQQQQQQHTPKAAGSK